MKIHIVGDGVFGKYLAKIFKPYIEISTNAEFVFLAVPFSAYAEVAKKYAGKHLVNVCSVQRETNKICEKFAKNYTGIHPLFGPRSPENGRTAILTHESDGSEKIREIFAKINCKIIETLPDGNKIDGDTHDKIMAQTHLAGLKLSKEIKKIVANSRWIPDECVPTSFLRLREASEQFGDFSPGTLSSMLSNPYWKK